MKLYGFIHICTLNHWRDIIAEQIKTIEDSGLMTSVSNIYCGVIGEEPFEHPHPKVSVIYQSPNIEEYEFATLKLLHEFCQKNRDSKVFYIHSKGVTGRGGDLKGPDPKRLLNVTDWRRFMEDIIIWRYKICVALLNEVDICGVNWRRFHSPPYLAGNFWWANAEYIANLPKFTPEEIIDRANAEFWIGKGKGTAASMWTSRNNHYGGKYHSKTYLGWTQPILFYNFENEISEPEAQQIEWRDRQYRLIGDK